MPQVDRAWPTSVAKAGSASVTPDMLIDTRASMPCEVQVIRWRSAVFSTNCVSWDIMPRSSQIEAISAGLTRVPSGRVQRISASAPARWPVASDSWG